MPVDKEVVVWVGGSTARVLGSTRTQPSASTYAGTSSSSIAPLDKSLAYMGSMLVVETIEEELEEILLSERVWEEEEEDDKDLTGAPERNPDVRARDLCTLDRACCSMPMELRETEEAETSLTAHIAWSTVTP
jgi:hypothetical protein